MEILFYISIFLPLFLGIMAIFFSQNAAKKYLNFIVISYFFLSVIALYFLFNKQGFSSSFFILDGLNIVFYTIIIVLSFIIWLYSISYFKTEIEHKVMGRWRLKQYNIMINLFIFSMLIVALSKNLMVMWIALEATTIFTTFLISFYNTKSSWEAAWKYVILCWIGVTIGLLWLFMIILSWVHNLDFTNIVKEAAVNTKLLEIAFVFILIWFGTKVWFFPLNSWLPDAHWKWSTPISAFMSSILLPLAFYMIIRTQSIIDVQLANNFTSNLMMFFSLLTIVYSGFVMLTQHHYKRTLAYSSSENMWIIAFAWALWTPVAQIFSLLHVIWHSFLKSASFMSAWNILLYTHTWQFDNIKNISKYMKNSSILLVISLFMLVWLPPSPLFISELGIIYQAFLINPLYALIFIIGIILAFTWLLYNFSSLFVDKENVDDLKKIDKDFKLSFMHLPIVLCLIISVIISVVFLMSFKF